MSQITVTLERHILKREHPILGLIDEPLPQHKIIGQFGDNKPGLIGYVGTQDNAPINLITPLPSDFQEEVKRQVRAQLATAADSISIPPTEEELLIAYPPKGDESTDKAEAEEQSTDEA